MKLWEGGPGYGIGRLWVEALRIDPATHLGGVRVHLWVSLVAVAAATIWLRTAGRRPPPAPTEEG